MTRPTKSADTSDIVRRHRAIPPSTRHRPTVSGANAPRVRATAWSYAHPASREVYIDVLEDGRHVGTVRVLMRECRRRA